MLPIVVRLDTTRVGCDGFALCSHKAAWKAVRISRPQLQDVVKQYHSMHGHEVSGAIPGDLTRGYRIA